MMRTRFLCVALLTAQDVYGQELTIYTKELPPVRPHQGPDRPATVWRPSGD